MADIHSLASVQHAVAAISSDPVQLHTQALNSLSRCKAMLLADEPMYTFAQQCLAEAEQAIAVLKTLETSTAH